jgi:hypothetical protein
MPFVTLVSLVLLGGVVGLLCFNTQMQQASFAATALEQQSTNLAAREQTLHDDLQQLRSPQHVATLAQAAGMVVPPTACTVHLAAGTTDKNCAAADATSTPRLLPEPPQKPAVLDPKPLVVEVPAAATVAGGHDGRSHHGRHQQLKAHRKGDTARR